MRSLLRSLRAPRAHLARLPVAQSFIVHVSYVNKTCARCRLSHSMMCPVASTAPRTGHDVTRRDPLRPQTMGCPMCMSPAGPGHGPGTSTPPSHAPTRDSPGDLRLPPPSNRSSFDQYIEQSASSYHNPSHGAQIVPPRRTKRTCYMHVRSEIRHQLRWDAQELP